MNTLITEGVQITVNTKFRPDLSNVVTGQYFFNYDISIENHNSFKIKLLNRDWYIFDSLSQPSFVSGAGVVGEQPILDPGKTYSYTSGCELFSEIGSMNGFYTFKNLQTGDLFQVMVPGFVLTHPPRLN